MTERHEHENRTASATTGSKSLFDRAGDIFLAVRELDRSAVQAAIDRACGEDTELKKIVLLLLRGDDAPLPVESLADGIRAACDALPTMESLASVAATNRIGNYTLLERIGEGGFGIVFLAEQTQPVQRQVAIKIIRLGMDTKQVVARFEAERQALAMMDHPNIAKVFDAGVTDTGRPYFVMEFVKGQPLTEFCDAHRLTIRERLKLLTQVCDALQHAHQRGVIHRDIKPSNVLVSGSAESPVSKIIDFGIAKAINAKLTEKTIFTEFRQMIGTPEYMSPEQAGESHSDIDTRSDIYGIGVLLYELLTGCTPFESTRLRSAAYGEMQRIIREEDPPPPSTKLLSASTTLTKLAQQRAVPALHLVKAVQGELDWIVMKALEKDRSRRYDSAGALSQDLQRYLSGEAVLAAPASKTYLARKFVRRHRGPVIATALIVVTLTSGLIGTTVGFLNANAQRSEAVREKMRANDKALEAERNAESEKAARVELEYQSYVANLVSASALLDNSKCGQVQDILSACPVPLRGWEWYWLKARADTSLAAMALHTDAITDLALSSDGSRLLTIGGNDCSAHIWDAQGGQHVVKLQKHAAAVNVGSLSPDGLRAAVASIDGIVRVSDAQNGTPLFELASHQAPLTRVVFSPDGKQFATSSQDSTAKLWDAATGTLLHTFDAHSAPVLWVAFSNDGTRVVTGSEDYSAIVWNTADGQQIVRLPDHMGAATQAEFSADGSKLLVRTWGPSRIWNVHTGEVICELRGNNDSVTWTTFSPDGTRVLAACLDGRTRVYDSTNGKLLQTLVGHQHSVNSATFSPDGKCIATASSDRSVIVWDTLTGERLGNFVGHFGSVNQVKYTPDGNRIVTIANDHVARLWDARPAEQSEVIRGTEGPIYHGDFSPDSTRIALPMQNNRAEVYSTSTGKRLVELLGHQGAVWSASFSPDGSRIVTSSFDGTARVWDSNSGKELLQLSGHPDYVVKARFNHAGTRIATACHDGKLRIWDANSGVLLLSIAAHSGWILDVHFSSDDSSVLTASADSTACLWNSGDGTLIQTFRGHTGICSSAVFSRDGKRILTGSRDNSVKIWDIATGAVLSTPVHTSEWIAAASFSPDNTRIVLSVNAGSAILVDASTGRFLTELRGHTKFVVASTFSPDGSMILTTSTDGTARLWHSVPFGVRVSHHSSASK